MMMIPRTSTTMWSILALDVGVAAKKSYAFIESRLFSLSSTNLKSNSSTQNAKEYARRRNDEEWHKKEMARKRDYIRRMRAENPGYDEHWYKVEREKYATNPRFKLKKLLSRWVRDHAWVRELPWKSYKPVYYTNPVQHRCDSCAITRRSGLLVVWQSIAQPDSYRCHACYMKQDLKACMPKGYEDVHGGIKQLAAREKELDDLGSEASRAASTADDVKG
ncbi:hypothetical protein E4T50_16675 [Aureobasidium sp. EXF-12298]|nr:hypothetical protein E4T50_16675 [Aureobasidium sp. EXF-12298]